IDHIIKEVFSVNWVKIIPINNHKYIFISKMYFNSLKIKKINIQNLIMLYLNIKVSDVLIKRI
ncbi:response regulator transcription factor, partial [Clostridium perfringens]